MHNLENKYVNYTWSITGQETGIIKRVGDIEILRLGELEQNNKFREQGTKSKNKPNHIRWAFAGQVTIDDRINEEYQTHKPVRIGLEDGNVRNIIKRSRNNRRRHQQKPKPAHHETQPMEVIVKLCSNKIKNEGFAKILSSIQTVITNL